MEILASSYVPHTHHIMHDVSILSIDNVITRHVQDCQIVHNKNNCIYNDSLIVVDVSKNEVARYGLSKGISDYIKQQWGII